jgi:hypothetical protein
MDNGIRYWGSTNSRSFEIGPFESRELALGATMAALGEKELPPRLFTAEEVVFPVRFNGEDLLNLLRRAYSLPEDWALVDGDGINDLERVLNRALAAWMIRFDVPGIKILCDKVVAHTVGGDR